MEKIHTIFEIFPQYFATSPCDFYNDEEIEVVKKLLLDLEIKLNIFDQNKTTQCIFWYMLFNFMTPTNCEIKLTTARRKLLAKKYCSKKADPESRSLQNVFRSLEKNGLIVKKYKVKYSLFINVLIISFFKAMDRCKTLIYRCIVYIISI